MRILPGLLPFLLHGTLCFAGDAVTSFDFTKQPPGDALPWLQSHGFETKLQFAKLHPRFQEGALWLSTEKPETGLCAATFPIDRSLRDVKKVRLTWGVARCPEGGDWEHGNNRTPLAVLISLGYEKLPSGLPFNIEPASWFITAFFGAREPEGKIYTGRLWKAGGRYVAVQPGRPGAAQVTELDLDQLFRSQFGKASTPPVSAVGIEMNTKDTSGAASAFVRKIEFLKVP